MCFAAPAEDAAATVLADVLKEAVDPPDKHYKEIALPQMPGAAGRLPQACTRQLTGRACRMLTARARAYEFAAGRVSALLEVLAVSRNRTLVARKKHDSQADMVQAAVRKVYAGLLVTALAQQGRASLAYANALHQHHLDVRIPAAVLKRLARQSVTSIYGRALIARLRSHGFTLREIDRALTPKRTRIGSFDLLSYLRRPVLPLPFVRYYNTIDINDLTVLVTGLAGQHALAASVSPQLFSDLDQARAACTKALRATAIRRFLKDAKPHLRPAYYSFLTVATQPMASGRSKVDPYPKCLN